ncbi:ubiquinol-cytochrome c reductase hinge protein [Salpingoeca rosetta]|uniref:Ubiquinol-cytochrome c reductase hinge protein n=1 Tax=Salpingoeca rosetta (strain ATCC 50818 / BSB-021) TaxID=946362 RepID=F2UD36_SALR5|nr:ubiquinol-cytochrome c reductase hinge protein [Salpingoeca rosetta]EGD74531.1 ubiquinol-cytochrome c reductase hinge protein [Salpingoeca rosetta]|eukprot:XP_004992788.1 ubiquinol-cytochrome c reductase hinge protein [Salpingoeca rosetta]
MSKLVEQLLGVVFAEPEEKEDPPADEGAEEEEDEDDEDEDEEEIEDPLVEIRSKCEGHCPQLKAELEKCAARVSSRSNTEETCTQELFDFLHCVDHCVSEELFKHLK